MSRTCSARLGPRSKLQFQPLPHPKTVSYGPDITQEYLFLYAHSRIFIQNFMKKNISCIQVYAGIISQVT